MNQEVLSLKDTFLKVYTLSKEIIAQSDYSEKLTEGWEYMASRMWESVNRDGQSSRMLQSKIKEAINYQFQFWETYIDTWTELFWQRALELGFNHPRKDLLRKVLDKGRFTGVGEAIHTRHEWPKLIQSELLQSRFNTAELARVQEIIELDEAKRMSLLKKCLRQKRVASSDYLRYGEAIAYFTRGKLFEGIDGSLLEQHFNKEELALLGKIWK